MHTKRKRRLYFILLLLFSIGTAIALSLYALRQNIDLYYTPTQLKQAKLLKGRELRLGGMVVKGSVKRVPNTLKVTFVLTDFKQQCTVQYNGILPSLFREGQGIVAEGQVNVQGVFIADQVLAKHDANYHPPGIPREGKKDVA